MIFVNKNKHKIQHQVFKMGTCQNNNTVAPDQPPTIALGSQAGVHKSESTSSNPFYELNANNANDHILSKYEFQSKYTDQFLGDCCVIQQKSTGDLYICKQIGFESDEHMKDQIAELEKRQRSLTSENVIQIKEVILKSADGFFGERKKVFIIIDYPFINFQREVADRIVKKISFTKQEINNFLTSTIKGYSAIERAGYHADKVRLKNIFVGIKSKQPVIKVAQSSLIEPKSNFQYMIDDGPNKVSNRDIYLSPQEYLAWGDDNELYRPLNNKSGVYSLGMCILDVCIMDPSREMYHFTEKQIDEVEVRNRIEIVGKKYGASVQKILKQMLEPDQAKRISFPELQQQLPTLTKGTNQASQMRLSVIPSQRSSFINNDSSNLRSSEMFKSVISNTNPNQSVANSRVFTSRIKMDKSRIKEEETLKITEHYTNGNKYYGEKRGNLKHGQGRYDLADGTYYEGEWSENKINGVGVLHFKNGRPEYEGQWRNDLYNGWGTLYTELGNWNKYEGQFKNGVKEGRGRIYFRDGTIYDGQFRGDKISGRGRKISQNGEVQQKYWDAINPDRFS